MKFTPEQRHQAMRRIEIDLVEYCDMHCYQCMRAVTAAPSTRKISTAQVDRFVAESLDLGYRWDVIHIIGGEPTLHPHFLAIAESLAVYKSFYPGCVLELRTNGGPRFEEFKNQLPQGIIVINAAKDKTNKDDLRHRDFYQAPCDHGVSTENMSCPHWVSCGLGLGPYGYIPCHNGACMPRVFGLDVAVAHLWQVTDEWFDSTIDKLCCKCGALLWENTKLTGSKMWTGNPNRGNISPTWRKAFDNYDIHKTDHLENKC